MKCPQCKSADLQPAKLEPNLGAHTCDTCGGTLLDLVAYRLWRETQATPPSATGIVKTPEETSQALLCSKCERIMLRFRYTEHTKHVLDLCSYCDDVWLQENEWEFMRVYAVQGDLPRVFTDPWQRKLRARRTKAVLDEEWDHRLGAELHGKAKEIDKWLREHPNRASFLDYLLASDPYDT